MKPWTQCRDWSTLVLGGLLVLAPFVQAAINAPRCTVGSTSWFYSPSTLDTWIVGILLIAVSLWALANPAVLATAWVRIVLGVWLFFVPWILGFVASDEVAWMNWSAGILVLALAFWQLLAMRTTQAKMPLC